MNTKKRSQCIRYVVPLVGLLFLLFTLIPDHQTGGIVSADDTASPTPSPTPDLEMERLKREADLAGHRATKAENEKRIAEAQKAALEARFPKPSTSPLEGTTTVEGAVIESQIISYKALKGVADQIVDAIKGRLQNNGKLAIYNERDVNLILSYRVAQAQVAIVQENYRELMATPTPTPSPSPTSSPSPGFRRFTATAGIRAAESFLGAFVDLTALLRTNVEVKGQTFVIDEGPLVAEVFRSARETDNTTNQTKIAGDLYYPYVFPVRVDSTNRSEFLAELEEARKLRVKAEKLFRDLVSTIEALSKTNDTIEQLDQTINSGIPKKTLATVLIAGNIIKANCPRLNGEVEFIKTLKTHKEQSAEMVKLIERVRKSCRLKDPDKLELLLGMSDTLKQLGIDEKNASDRLANARTEQQRLITELMRLQRELKLQPIQNPPDLDKVQAQAEDAIARLKAINAQFDSLIAALIEGEAGNGNALTNYLRIERLLEVIGQTDYWLQVKVINAGGNNRIKTNLIVDIFRGGNRVSHSGGVIAQYNLFKPSGQSVVSGVASAYTKYIDAGKIR
jgi:hypothetical protein